MKILKKEDYLYIANFLFKRFKFMIEFIDIKIRWIRFVVMFYCTEENK